MISFQNDGLIDIRAVRTFGVSSKEVKNPIGFFGTGLKYAIAITLRHNGKITLFRGLERFDFDTVQARIRVDDFNLITMNGDELGFTSHVGANWEPWQVFRELMCNAKDEPNGKCLPSRMQPEEGKTTIWLDAPFCDEVWTKRHEIILEDIPTWKFGEIEVHDKHTVFPYYKGIRVGLYQQPAHFLYNVTGTHVSLTEDRILSSHWDYHRDIGRNVVQCDNEEFVRRFVTAPKGVLENIIDLDYSAYAPRKAFLDAMSKLSFGQITNPSAIKVYKKYTGKEYTPDEEPLTEVETMQLHKAREFLKKLGYNTDNETVVVTKDLRDDVLGMVYQNQIYLNRRVFMMGTKMVAGTLWEEWLHKTKNLHDECRPMQNFLIDTVMTMGETLNKEPL